MASDVSGRVLSPFGWKNVSKNFDEGAEVNGEEGMVRVIGIWRGFIFLMSKGVLFTFSMQNLERSTCHVYIVAVPYTYEYSPSIRNSHGLVFKCILHIPARGTTHTTLSWSGFV